jgi:hypothetical protein
MQKIAVVIEPCFDLRPEICNPGPKELKAKQDRAWKMAKAEAAIEMY